MRAVVLSIGSELLRGDIVDTNATFLTRQLSHLGFKVLRVEQIGDDRESLQQAFRQAMDMADVTICTGGLGPTRDDLTRESIAAVLGENLDLDSSLLSQIELRFSSMGRRMPRTNARQAMLIPSAEALSNPNGTAPGWFVQKEGRVIAAMPGPPSEMEPMWQDSVQPRLEKLLNVRPAMTSLMTFGMGESTVEERIADVITWRGDVIVATYAKAAGVEIHVTARSRDATENVQLVEDAEARLRERLGNVVFGTRGETLSSVVGRLLRHESLTLAVMESCTGGQLSSTITDNAGSSTYFHGGIVAYTQEAKARYGVDEGVMRVNGLISPETAMSMAGAARRQLGAHLGLGVTGIAGDEPVEGKAPGTVYLALQSERDEEVREIHRPGKRAAVKTFASLCALDLLRRRLIRSRTPEV